MRFDFLRTPKARALFAWVLFIFFISLITPASVSHTGGYAHIYTRSIEALHATFTFDTADLFLAPGMPLALGLAEFVVPLWPDGIRLFQFGLYVLLILLTFFLARLMFQERSNAGSVSMFIMALSPVVLIQIFSLGPDLLYAVLFLTGIVFALRVVRNKGSAALNAAVSGAALGYAALTDPIGLFVPALVFVWMGIVLVLERTPIKHLALIAVLFAGASIAMLLPWYARNIVVFGADEAPIVQKRVEREIITDARTVQLALYPFTHTPLVVLEKASFMFLVPPDLDFFDQNTKRSYRDILRGFITAGDLDASAKELRVLFVKMFILSVHVSLLALGALGLWFERRNATAWLTVLLVGYVSFSVIAYASFNLFRGVSPFNEFIFPLYGLIYSFAALAILRLKNILWKKTP